MVSRMDSVIIPVAYVLAVLFSVVIHEVSHGAMANALGDQTAKHLGRLTLNPIRHLDLFGSILLPFLLFVIGSPVMFGYAKPVPYNPLNLRDRKYGPAKVAFAGPFSNIILAVLFGATFRFLPAAFVGGAGGQVLSYVVLVNLMLAVFNLFPIPPLDGHWLLMTFLPQRYAAFKLALYRFSFLLLIVFIFFIFPLIFPLVLWIFRALTGVSPF